LEFNLDFDIWIWKLGFATFKTMICSTPAFVLRTYDFRETSKMANFFTRDFGKIKGILKGIRKDPKKFSSTLPLLSLNHIVFYKKRTSEIHLIGQCDLIDDFDLTRGTLKSFGFSSYAAELVELLMPLEDANSHVFSLIFDFLNTLKTNDIDSRQIFQIKILALSGFKPHLDSCLSCDVKLLAEAYFSHSRGGLLCPKCLYQDKHAEPIYQGTIATILYIERSSWSSCLRLNMLPAVRKQLEKILTCFVQFHVGRSLKTPKLIHEILDQ
jgi:DNA repair protein RecO (recombination protein O)